MLPIQPILSPNDYADIGSKASPMQRDTWNALRMEYDKATRYYSGEIFQDRVDVEAGEDGQPLLYPVGVNLVKLLVLSMTDAILGEHDENDPILFVSRNNRPSTPETTAGIEYMSRLLHFSNAASLFWELEFSRNLYGACAFRIAPSMLPGPHIKWTKIPIQNFFPVFNPEDPDELIEVYITTPLTREQVQVLYGIEPTSEFPVKVEHWTRAIYETSIDGRRVDPYSGVNPYHVVPFVYVPRVRTVDWLGESLAADLYKSQDELNMRLADIGDTLNYNSHPIVWGVNMPKGFNAQNFPLAANALWDLGRSFGAGNSKPEVGILQAQNPVPEASFKHIQFIYDWVRTSSFAPPIAFGEDSGGGQRSGVTLEIRLWPLLKAVRRSRSYLTTGIHRAMQITATILSQKSFSDIDKNVIAGLSKGDVTAQYHHVLPRDQAAVVDEVVKLLSTEPPAISLETAQETLGRGMSEVTRIITMMADHPDWFQKATALVQGNKKGDEGSPSDKKAEQTKPEQMKPGGKDE